MTPQVIQIKNYKLRVSNKYNHASEYYFEIP